MTLTTNPGSPEAMRLGCTCPVLDNAYGKGAILNGQLVDNEWYVDEHCPIHVDKRRLDAATGGEGDSGTAGQPDDRARDDSPSDPVPTESDESASEGQGSAPLSGADGGRSIDLQVREGEASERPAGGSGTETPA